METKGERRLRKLRELCEKHGGHTAVADKAEVSDAYLDQILKGVLLPAKRDGTRSPRILGDDAARKIEKAYGLEAGWFDSDQAVAPMPRRIRKLVEQLTAIEDASVLNAILLLAEAHAVAALERQAQSQGQAAAAPSKKRAQGR